MLKSSSHQPVIMEITVMSAQGLKDTNSSLFSHRLRPFITLSTVPPFSYRPATNCQVYKTRVDDGGGVNPSWGDKFQLPIDATFFYKRHSCIYLQLYTKHLMVGKTLLGWCQIPATDVADSLLPATSVRHLSYRLRARDGSRGHGVVNIAVKLEGLPPVECPEPRRNSYMTHSPEIRMDQTVVGIPMTMFPAIADRPVMGHTQYQLGGCGGEKITWP